MLEQLCDSEEEGGGLLGAESLADIEQVDNLCEEDSALSGTDRRFVEDARFLDHGLPRVRKSARMRDSLSLHLRGDGGPGRGVGRVRRGEGQRDGRLTVLSWKKDPTPPPPSSSFL